MTPARYRVFHLIKGLGRGGAEKLLTEGLRFSGSEFHYGYGYFLPWKDALVPELKSYNAEVRCFHAGSAANILLSFTTVAAFLQEWKADLVHCHLPLAGVTGRLAGAMSHTPVVYTEHYLHEGYHFLTQRLNRWTWNLQEHVVAVSSEVADSIHNCSGNKIPVTVVDNGVDTGAFRRDPAAGEIVRDQLGIPRDACVLGTVAVFRPSKNLLMWLAAARQIADRSSGTYFLLVGDGPMRRELENARSALHLNDRLILAGMQENVGPWLSAMDVYMSSSIYEGLPVAILEAMSMELPIVSTTTGGLRAVVKNGVTGYAIEHPSAESLAQKALMLVENPRARRQFGASGRKLVEQRYDLKSMVRRLEQIYVGVLKNGSTGPEIGRFS